jgi:hypothetical protein
MPVEETIPFVTGISVSYRRSKRRACEALPNLHGTNRNQSAQMVRAATGTRHVRTVPPVSGHSMLN